MPWGGLVFTDVRIAEEDVVPVHGPLLPIAGQAPVAGAVGGSRRLVALPDATAVWPTHGAGSFCSAPPGSERTTTIGAQKRTNDLLAAPDEDAFVARLLCSLGSYPAYFDRLAELNRQGPALLNGAPGLEPLTPARVRALLADGAHLVDARPVAAFAAGHIPGAVSNPLRPAFATWPGWLLPPDAPLVFVLEPGQDPAELAWQAAKIGYDRLAGQLAGSMDAWHADSGPIETIALVTADQIGDRPVLDVRQQAEFTTGHIPGAAHTELGNLAADGHAIGDGTVVMCGHGERAMTAASLLARQGTGDLAVLVGGAQDWAEATGRPLTWAPSWGWIVFANVLLGVNQGLTWSTTVIMKIDLVGPARRGLAMGFS